MSYRAKDFYRDSGVAADYDRKRFTNAKGRLVDRREQSMILASVRRLGVVAGASVLDVPCGTGRLSGTLAGAGYRVTGVDVSEAMLDQARVRLGSLPETARPTLQVGDAEGLPFDDASFDIVVSLRLFGHLPHETRGGVLRQLARVSRGPVIVAWYTKLSLQSRLRAGRRRGPWFPVNLATIDAELAAAGLRRVGRDFLLPLISETVVVAAVPA